MTPCSEFDLLLSLRAAGALGPVEAPAVEAHLAVCPACRAEAEARAEALFLARLPPASLADQAAFRDLPAAMLRDLRASGRRRGLGMRIAVGIAISAAAAAVVLAPALLRKAPPGVGATQVVATQAASRSAGAAWEAPDPDTLWEDAGFLEDDSSAATRGGDATDAVLAALEY